MAAKTISTRYLMPSAVQIPMPIHITTRITHNAIKTFAVKGGDALNRPDHSALISAMGDRPSNNLETSAKKITTATNPNTANIIPPAIVNIGNSSRTNMIARRCAERKNGVGK